jgi:hypothetical protein
MGSWGYYRPFSTRLVNLIRVSKDIRSFPGAACTLTTLTKANNARKARQLSPPRENLNNSCSLLTIRQSDNPHCVCRNGSSKIHLSNSIPPRECRAALETGDGPSHLDRFGQPAPIHRLNTATHSSTATVTMTATVLAATPRLIGEKDIRLIFPCGTVGSRCLDSETWRGL